MSADPSLLESAARSVLADAQAGRVVSPQRIKWAIDTMAECDKRRSEVARRFDGWLAGATKEQADKWSELQASRTDGAEK